MHEYVHTDTRKAGLGFLFANHFHVIALSGAQRLNLVFC